MSSFARRLLVIAALLGMCAPALADATDSKSALILNSGEHVLGHCEGVSEGRLRWRSKYGGIAYVAVSGITSVVGEVECDLVLTDGERIRGRWKVENGVLLVDSPSLGRLQFPAGLLTSAVPAVSAQGLNDGAPSTPSPTAPAATSSPSNGAAAAKDTTDAPSNRVGQAQEPPPSSLQSLLRSSSILLRPGEWNVATTLHYLHDHTLYSATDQRSLAADVRLQRGLSPRLEADLVLSGSVTRVSTLVLPTTAAGSVSQSHSTRVRAGDPEVALSSLLWDEKVTRPEAVLTTGVTIPANSAKNDGLFRTRVGLELLKTSDPGAVFAGIGWIHELNGWSRSQFRLRDHVSYHFGMALGVSDELAVGVAVQGEYIPDLVNRKGELVAVSVEPVVGKFWINYRISHQEFVEVAALPAMNDDAHSTSFLTTYIHRF